MKILLVEDEKRMVEALSALLGLEGYETVSCMDGTSGLEKACTERFDLILLDVMLPGISGYEIVKSIREAGIMTPVLMLTAKSEVDDKVMGLDYGADDYLTKPFETKELLARCRALGRRREQKDSNDLSAGDIRLDANALKLTCTSNGQSVKLSKKEARILELFISNQQHILTREQLALKIWGYESEAEYNNVEVYISFTRKKLTFLQSKMQIKALRGVGYELREEEDV